MKKFLAMAMAACMAFTMVACGGAASSTASSAAATSEAASAESTTGAKTDVAFVTDVGNIDDQSSTSTPGRACRTSVPPTA